jgi:hypothetical protein
MYSVKRVCERVETSANQKGYGLAAGKFREGTLTVNTGNSPRRNKCLSKGFLVGCDRKRTLKTAYREEEAKL